MDVDGGGHGVGSSWGHDDPAPWVVVGRVILGTWLAWQFVRRGGVGAVAAGLVDRVWPWR